ncbi:MerR family transcriptional regulator [Bacillus massilinigeriensis]|uniref:MerR family transcriptional regulator n=1 Tax=Bacillus massilionigeriensis TaxID=1805475 RepID=UPI00096AE2EE|nr:MerR family transcriptional regulator [Bacillus massilionigeriensis]
MRWYDGAVYRIGELANKANVSKRTIDYYTSLGLLIPNRTQSNYRLYSEESLYDLSFISECKKMHIPLDEIKRKLEMKKSSNLHNGEMEKQINAVTQQMKQLENDISYLVPLLEKLDDEQKKCLSQKLSSEGAALIKSLMKISS